LTIKEKFGDLIEKMVEECPSPGKHAARSAIRHMKKAWVLSSIDKEMAAFRAITGEEESATAVFHSVMRRKYRNAAKLDITSHIHKTALHPFLLGVGKLLREIYAKGGYNPTLECNENPRHFKTRITVKMDGDEKWVYFIPPLHFTVSVNNEVHDFSTALNEMSSEKKAKNISKYVTKLAKRRNRILYATSGGMPSIANDIGPFLIYRESVIYTNLVVYLMIDPYKERQCFVQQCLDSFIKILPHVRGTSKQDIHP
jgi:hypothetical protein